MFSYNTAKELDTEKRTFALGDCEAQICAQSVSTSSNGNLMINLRWECMSGDNAGKKIGPDRVVLSADSLFRLDVFMAAIRKDPAKEFGGQTVDETWLTAWAECLLGECAIITIGTSKPSAAYPDVRPEVKAYKPTGSVKNASSLVDLD